MVQFQNTHSARSGLRTKHCPYHGHELRHRGEVQGLLCRTKVGVQMLLKQGQDVARDFGYLRPRGSKLQTTQNKAVNTHTHTHTHTPDFLSQKMTTL